MVRAYLYIVRSLNLTNLNLIFKCISTLSCSTARFKAILKNAVTTVIMTELALYFAI